MKVLVQDVVNTGGEFDAVRLAYMGCSYFVETPAGAYRVGETVSVEACGAPDFAGNRQQLRLVD